MIIVQLELNLFDDNTPDLSEINTIQALNLLQQGYYLTELSYYPNEIVVSEVVTQCAAHNAKKPTNFDSILDRLVLMPSHVVQHEFLRQNLTRYYPILATSQYRDVLEKLVYEKHFFTRSLLNFVNHNFYHKLRGLLREVQASYLAQNPIIIRPFTDISTFINSMNQLYLVAHFTKTDVIVNLYPVLESYEFDVMLYDYQNDVKYQKIIAEIEQFIADNGWVQIADNTILTTK